ncbi:DUF488 family protein [Actinomycetospora straminea]
MLPPEDSLTRHDRLMVEERPVRVATVGYEGATAEELVTTVAAAGATLLVDLRQTPLSRKAGLSKRKLADHLEREGVSYMHMPALGNPRDNREPYRVGCPEARERFLSILRSTTGRAALDELWSLAASQSVVLLCYERDASSCHRDMVTKELARQEPSLSVLHL